MSIGLHSLIGFGSAFGSPSGLHLAPLGSLIFLDFVVVVAAVVVPLSLKQIGGGKLHSLAPARLALRVYESFRTCVCCPLPLSVSSDSAPPLPAARLCRCCEPAIQEKDRESSTNSE